MKFTDLEYGDKLVMDGQNKHGIIKVLKVEKDYMLAEVDTSIYVHATREEINEDYKKRHPEFSDYIDALPKNRMVTRWSNEYGDISWAIPLQIKIADTKINRKLYAGKIKREGKGYIIVAMS